MPRSAAPAFYGTELHTSASSWGTLSPDLDVALTQLASTPALADVMLYK